MASKKGQVQTKAGPRPEIPDLSVYIGGGKDHTETKLALKLFIVTLLI